MQSSSLRSSAALASEEAVAATFDKWVREGLAEGMERRHRRLAERMLERVEIRRDSSVLDIGCGDGWLLRLIAGSAPDAALAGIDVSMEMVHAARLACAALDNVMIAPGAAEEIPWAGGYFSCVLSVESAYYWPEPARAAGEIFRVTKPGGSFHVLINYYEENPFSDGWEVDTGLHLHRFDAAAWASLFEDAGFGSVGTDQIPDDSPISPGKTPPELARRQGLQDVGALYVWGRRPQVDRPVSGHFHPVPNPFRIVR